MSPNYRDRMRGGVMLATAALLAVAAFSIPAQAATKSNFALTSTTFSDQGTIPVDYTCKGAGKSPALAWTGLPKGTKQLALIMEDPDTPIGTFVHWVVGAIKPKPASVADNTEPSGVAGNNGAGRSGWIPPCPPAGPAHHYIFTLYSLDKKVTPAAGVNAAMLRALIRGKVLARAKLTGLFGT